MAKDLHLKPFDESTKAKLAIFQDYIREWLPVFVSARKIYWDTINIYDFFAGPGKDIAGVNGTPCIIVDELKPYLDDLKKKGLAVNLYFNEFDKDKYQQLNAHFVFKDRDVLPYKVEIDSLDFKESFLKKLPDINKKDTTNLLFLDQYGIKHIGEDVFKQIINVKTTDFLFFISSSTIKRFCDHPNILQHINLSPEEVEQTPYYQIHRLVLDYYRSLIPIGKTYYLASFSLKRGSNVYGLIFGSGHVLGIEKFLTTCWKIDPARGEANFDIDNDKIKPDQLNLFTGEITKPKKTEVFEKELMGCIEKLKLLTDKDVYLFTITNGFLPSHGRGVLKRMVSEKRIQEGKFDLSSKICKFGAKLTAIKIIK